MARRGPPGPRSQGGVKTVDFLRTQDEGGEAMRKGYASMARKRYLLQAVIGIFFCSLATVSASEPTLQETLDFIERKLTGTCISFTSRKDEKNFQTFGFKDYAISLLDDNTILITSQGVDYWQVYEEDQTNGRFKLGDRYSRRTTWTMRYKVRLSDLNTQVEIVPYASPGVGIASWLIAGECTEKDCIEWEEINKKEDWNIRASGGRFYRESEGIKIHSVADKKGLVSSASLFRVCSQKNTEKIKKALTHAIKLSGGKDELF